MSEPMPWALTRNTDNSRTRKRSRGEDIFSILSNEGQINLCFSTGVVAQAYLSSLEGSRQLTMPHTELRSRTRKKATAIIAPASMMALLISAL